MQNSTYRRVFRATDDPGLLPSPPQIGQLLRQR